LAAARPTSGTRKGIGRSLLLAAAQRTLEAARIAGRRA